MDQEPPYAGRTAAERRRLRRTLLQMALLLSIAPALLVVHANSEMDQQGYKDAATLRDAGPHGRAAYVTAMADGKITNDELRRIREAALPDIDASLNIADTGDR